MFASKLLTKTRAFEFAAEEAERILMSSNHTHTGINVVFAADGRRLNHPWGVTNEEGVELQRHSTLGQAMSQATVNSFKSGTLHRVVARFNNDVVLMTVTRRSIDITNHPLIVLHNVGRK